MFQKIRHLVENNRLIFSNISYMGVMQIANYVFPFITIPYLVKTLSKESFGVYSVGLILMSYIGIVIDYGFNLTATREIAIHKSDKKKLNALSSAVFYIKIFFFVLISACGVIAASLHLFSFYTLFAFLLFAFGQVLFPVWFLQGVENMRILTVFNTCSKTVSTISIFLLVKQPDAAEQSMVLYALGTFIAGITSFLYVVRKYSLQFVRTPYEALRRMVTDGFDIFLTSLFSNVIINGGALVLGYFGGMKVVGIYSAIEKIARAMIGVLSAVTQVIYPGIARTLAQDKKAGIALIKNTGTVFMLFLSAGCIGLMLFSPWILELLYGSFYIPYSYVLCFLLVWVIFSFINNFIGIQFLVGSGNNKYYRKAFSITTLYIIASFSLIKIFYLDGLIFSMLSGELFLTLSMLFLIRKNKLLTA